MHSQQAFAFDTRSQQLFTIRDFATSQFASHLTPAFVPSD